MSIAVSQGSILLVEPPENDRPMYADYLRDQGYSVTEVDSTDAGLSAAQAADLVITGVRVAGSFDGIELVRRLRGSEHTKNTPLIVLTACAFEPDQARAFAAGCDVFLPKPCLPETLLAEARRLIEEATHLRAQAVRVRATGVEKRRMSKALLDRSTDLVKRVRQRKHSHR
jgi:two-component system cell cycle response regulator DivK